MSVPESEGPWRIAALYAFTPLPDPHAMCERLLGLCRTHKICGTLLLATEGINGTVAGQGDGVRKLVEALREDPRLRELDVKYSSAARRPFHRLKVRLKREIVTLGRPEADPTRCVGTYVEPEDWNALIRDPDVVTLDTRNAFEVGLGSFQGALDPETKSFRDFPDWVEANRDRLAREDGTPKPIAMFCTGGIRCEKASSWMLQNGFEDVYHLKGGILRYLETQDERDSLWNGECFVFDERVAVGHGLREGDATLCRACRAPLRSQDRTHPDFEDGVACAGCAPSLTSERRARLRERHRQVALASRRGERHIGRKAN